MGQRTIKKGSADQSVVIRIIDSGDGTPETGVTSATTGLDLKYRRDGAVTADLTESDLSALDDAHSDGGLLHIGAGYYRLDIPDAAFGTGATGVLIFGTVTGMVVVGCYIPLVDNNATDVYNRVDGPLPAADADAAGGLPISDAGGLDLDAKIGALTFTVANKVDANTTHFEGSDASDVLDALTTAQTNIANELAKVPKSDSNVSWNATALAAINAEADSAIETYHLDHLLAATYDPASKPGAADALLNELVESDAGVSRFTANALEEAPSGGGGGDATEANQTTIIAELAKVPKSDSNVTWNATAAAQIQLEANDALVAYDPPTRDEALDDRDYLENTYFSRWNPLWFGETGTVVDTTPSTTVFETSLTAADGFWDDALIVFGSGSALEGQSRTILSYLNANGQITVDEAFTEAPGNGDAFSIRVEHIHPISQIQAGLSTLDAAGVRTAVGLAAANLDTQLGAIAGYIDTEVAAILAAIDTEVAAILTDTNELQLDWTDGGRLDLLLDAVKVVTDALTSAGAAKLAISAGTIVTGTVNDANTAPSTTQFAASDITEATPDHFIGRVIIFTSGALDNQATDITDYALTSGEGVFTVTAMTEAPADGDTFIII